MFLIGLTGGIASGKSLVSSMMQDLNVELIDADEISHRVTSKHGSAYKKVVEEFGSDILQPDGNINRAKLGNIIFSNVEKRKALNKIVHPCISKEIKNEISQRLFKGCKYVVLDIPLLFETQRYLPYLYKTIVVSCDEETQIERLMKRNGYSRSEAIQRIKCQLPLSEKTEKANFVIENSSSIANTRKQVEDIVKCLEASKRHIYVRLIYGIPLFLVIFLMIALTIYLVFYLVSFL